MVSTHAPEQTETKVQKSAKESASVIKDERKTVKSSKLEAISLKSAKRKTEALQQEKLHTMKNQKNNPVNANVAYAEQSEIKGSSSTTQRTLPEKSSNLTDLFTAGQNTSEVVPFVVKKHPIDDDINFSEGDYVVYPTHGVGKVNRIVTENIAGQTLQLVVVTFSENHMTLRVPVHKAPSAGLRKLSSRKQFDEALSILKGKAKVKRIMWSRRAQEYEAKINSGSPIAVAEVIRDLHRNVNQPDQSFSERQIFEAALDRLATEYAAIKKINKVIAAEELLTFIKSAPITEAVTGDSEEETIDDINLHIAEAL